MSSTLKEVHVWQRMVTPHMTGLANSLLSHFDRVVYVAQEEVLKERQKQGWKAPKNNLFDLRICTSRRAVHRHIRESNPRSVHICQGIRANGIISYAQRQLAKRGLQQWVLLEQLDDSGLAGPLKRFLYSFLIQRTKAYCQGYLAIGEKLPDWLAERGADKSSIYPFSYFLPRPEGSIHSIKPESTPFRFIFVGQLIERKNLKLLLKALDQLQGYNFSLTVVGDGPEYTRLRKIADRLLPKRVYWMGRVPMNEVGDLIRSADCLVLPSRHDGWGAVVTESLMRGTPAICSDACGAMTAVISSGVGGVFSADQHLSLANLLKKQLCLSPLDQRNRQKLASWALCFSSDAGASYFASICLHLIGQEPRPTPPWQAVPSSST